MGWFKDKTLKADLGAADLKKIKMDAAKGEGEVFQRFARRNQRVDDRVKEDIGRDDKTLVQAEKDANMKMADRRKQRGSAGGATSIYSSASRNLGRDTAEKREFNRGSFGKRKDAMMDEFGAVSRSTLSGTNVGMRFNDVKQDSFAKSLFKGSATAAVGGFASSYGQAMGKRNWSSGGGGNAEGYLAPGQQGPPMPPRVGYGSRARGYIQQGFQSSGHNYVRGSGTRGRQHIQQGFQRR